MANNLLRRVQANLLALDYDLDNLSEPLNEAIMTLANPRGRSRLPNPSQPLRVYRAVGCLLKIIRLSMGPSY